MTKIRNRKKILKQPIYFLMSLTDTVLTLEELFPYLGNPDIKRYCYCCVSELLHSSEAFWYGTVNKHAKFVCKDCWEAKCDSTRFEKKPCSKQMQTFDEISVHIEQKMRAPTKAKETFFE